MSRRMAVKPDPKPFVADTDNIDLAVDKEDAAKLHGARAGSPDHGLKVDNGRKVPLDLSSALGQPTCEPLPETGGPRGNGQSASNKGSTEASASDPPVTCPDFAPDTGSPPEVRGFELHSDNEERLPGPLEPGFIFMPRKRSPAVQSGSTSGHTRPAADNQRQDLILRPTSSDRANRKVEDEEHDGTRKLGQPAKKRRQ